MNDCAMCNFFQESGLSKNREKCFGYPVFRISSGWISLVSRISSGWISLPASGSPLKVVFVRFRLQSHYPAGYPTGKVDSDHLCRADAKWFYCDRKAWAASAQRFTLWQETTVEITCRDHCIIACSHHIYMGAVLRAHPVCGESHIQRNVSGKVATVSLTFIATKWFFQLKKLSSFSNISGRS